MDYNLIDSTSGLFESVFEITVLAIEKDALVFIPTLGGARMEPFVIVLGGLM